MIFSILDVESFKSQIQEINNELKIQNQTLPQIDLNQIIQISSLFGTKNETHVKILIEIPIIKLNENPLKEIIPIPFREKHEVKILKINSFYYFINERQNNKIMTQEQFGSCITQKGLILCNSVLKSKLTNKNECINSLITNKQTNSCEDLKILKRNYIIETSKYSTYCFVIEPFKLRITCNDENFIYNLTGNKEIIYEENCNVFKVLNENVNNISTYKSIEIFNEYVKPNFTIFNTKINNWTNDINMINKNKVELLELLNETIVSGSEYDKINKQEKKGFFNGIHKTIVYCFESISTGFGYIFKLFSNITGFFYLVIILMIVVIIYKICKCA